jgi:hypothetical protein
MFDRYVAEKVKIEKEIADEIEVFTKDSVLSSDLSEFTKNYVIRNAHDTKIADDVYSQIEKAVKLRFNYTIRPKWTLINFLFNRYESRPPQEILNKLKVFPFYKFYKDAITNFIQDNTLVFITDKQVEGIIDDTNSLIYEKLIDTISNVKIKNFFLQLFKLKYEYDHEINLDSSIPFLFIKIFLEDKSFDDQLKKFDLIKEKNDETEISLKDVIKILTGKYSFTKKLSQESSGMPIEIKLTEPKKEVKNDNEEIIIKKPVFEKKKENEHKPEGKIEVKDEDLYSKELLKADDEHEEQEKDVKIETISEATLEERESANSINNLFTNDELKDIADKIYSSSKILRHRSFEELDKMKTWKEAINHLEKIFEDNNVDIYDKEVVKFVDILNDHFKKIESEIPEGF